MKAIQLLVLTAFFSEYSNKQEVVMIYLVFCSLVTLSAGYTIFSGILTYRRVVGEYPMVGALLMSATHMVVIGFLFQSFWAHLIAVVTAIIFCYAQGQVAPRYAQQYLFFVLVGASSMLREDLPPSFHGLLAKIKEGCTWDEFLAASNLQHEVDHD